MAPAAAPRSHRMKLFIGFAAGLLLAGGSYKAYEAMSAGHVTTDNAYVGADVAQVTPLVGGPVREVLVQDTRQVRRGEILVRLDDTDARIALARAEAELAAAERRVRSLVANDGERSAQVSARSADAARASAQIAAARADLDRAGIDLHRRQDLAQSGAISDEELTTARNAYSTASANLRAAQAALAQAAAQREAAVGSRSTNQALIGDGRIDTNPDVLAARAAVAQARLDLERTVIRAPVDGIVSRRQVQVGQRVQAGAMLMAIVPVQSAYVDANFKEVELTDVRPGQKVTLTSDLYGDDVEFHGRVAGFSGGTGAAFALVPAQNATGNWIKVVQRLPVRIALDPRELARRPLRVGLSMTATVDTAD
ncbi:MAG: efflux RND transporter periplasmic adaptor subunit [Alphaproteobacteria bacterium]|nr:efflux RND transporter periplasmic adaptor subunit [Alphaproteobacteria bacterium]MBV9371104.1 efflux RND transporter periplasmic adaptor subunit [Alphaproteobacteria bacterium]MBV9901522.1 efflux RND transporter periplasmic adaptor subunit [Alphaproteobacteria bacterium]